MLKKYKNNQLTKVILTILIIWTLGALIISAIEPGSFKKISNSLWWAIVTMTTVGYGDMAPTTIPGRILAVFIMLTGIVLVAIVTATISSSFITKNALMTYLVLLSQKTTLSIEAQLLYHESFPQMSTFSLVFYK